jgi:hypothetical protein
VVVLMTMPMSWAETGTASSNRRSRILIRGGRR